MNWVAHIFLSEQDIHFQIANYLADPLKAKVWDNANQAIHKGMATHIQIDSFTDQHPLFKQSKQRLKEHGLLRGVVIDLTYDYLLTKNWENFCHIKQRDFLNNFHNEANTVLHTLPNHAQKPLKRMIEFEILHQYQTLEQLKEALARIDRRVSQRVLKRDRASNYFEKVIEHIDSIEQDFLEFFPQLCYHIKPQLNQSNLKHWKI